MKVNKRKQLFSCQSTALLKTLDAVTMALQQC